MKIRSVAILGAGAVGSYLLWGLTDKPGVTVSVVAEGTCAVPGVRSTAKPTARRYCPPRKPTAQTCDASFFVSFLEKCFARRLTSENLSKNLKKGVDISLWAWYSN